METNDSYRGKPYKCTNCGASFDKIVEYCPYCDCFDSIFPIENRNTVSNYTKRKPDLINESRNEEIVCPNCGAPNNKAEEYCPYCETSLVETDSVNGNTKHIVSNENNIVKTAGKGETMKKFIVSEKCNSCGLCTVSNDFLTEDAEGKAVPIPGKLVKPKDEAKANEIIRKCPVRALSLDVVSNAGSADEVKKEAIKKLSAISEMNIPPQSEFRFEQNDYYISTPFANGEYDYKYSSYNSAMSAAEQEFNRQMYSKIKSILMQLVMQYKSRKLKKYYSDDGDNVFDKKNDEIRKILQEIAGKYESVTGKALPSGFTEFDAYPDRDRYSLLNMIRKDEVFAEEIVNHIKRELDSSGYSSLSDYRNYWDVDDEDTWVGTNVFGNDKYKTMYCYRDMNEAFNELAKDLLSNTASADIDKLALEKVNALIKSYNTSMNKLIKEKIAFIEKA